MPLQFQYIHSPGRSEEATRGAPLRGSEPNTSHRAAERHRQHQVIVLAIHQTKDIGVLRVVEGRAPERSGHRRIRRASVGSLHERHVDKIAELARRDNGAETALGERMKPARQSREGARQAKGVADG